MKPLNHELAPQSPEVIYNPGGETVALRFDVLPLLEENIGSDWQRQLTEAIEKEGDLNWRDADGHYTNREAGNTAKMGLIMASGAKLVTKVPVLQELYQGPFIEMMRQALPEGSESIKAYEDTEEGHDLAFEGYSQVPTVRQGDSEVAYRMENHVDQRYTLVLAVDVPFNESDGGRLVVANNPDAQSVEETNEDATYIMHRSGTVVCFSRGKKYPHYTEEVTNPAARRITISINYPVESESPEEAAEISQYIKGIAPAEF